MATTIQGSVTITDLNDAVLYQIYLTNNNSLHQIKTTTGTYVPDWSTTHLVITPNLYISGLTGNQFNSTYIPTVTWKDSTGTALVIDGSVHSWNGKLNYSINATTRVLTISSNLVTTNGESDIFYLTGNYSDSTTGNLIPFSVPVTLTATLNGTTGLNAVNIILTTPQGDSFVNGNVSSLSINAIILDGGTDVTNSSTFQWAKLVSGSYVNISGATGSTLTVSPSDVIDSEVYRCSAVYKSTTYINYQTITDKSDPIQVQFIVPQGIILRNTVTSATASAHPWRNATDLDPTGADYTYVWTFRDKTGATISTPAGVTGANTQTITVTKAATDINLNCDVTISSAGTIIAQGTITFSTVLNGYTTLLSPSTINIPANSDGSNPVLAEAQCKIVYLDGNGDVMSGINITGVTPTNCTASYATNIVTITSITAGQTSGSVLVSLSDGTTSYSATVFWQLAKQGAVGPSGPTQTFAGNWDSGTVYYGGTDRVQVVKYTDGDYYETLQTAGGDISAGTLPTNTIYYKNIGSSYSAIATGLLIAELAQVDNLSVSFLRTGIPDTGVTGTEHIEIYPSFNTLAGFRSQGVSEYATLTDTDLQYISDSIIFYGISDTGSRTVTDVSNNSLMGIRALSSAYPFSFNYYSPSDSAADSTGKVSLVSTTGASVVLRGTSTSSVATITNDIISIQGYPGYSYSSITPLSISTTGSIYGSIVEAVPYVITATNPAPTINRSTPTLIISKVATTISIPNFNEVGTPTTTPFDGKKLTIINASDSATVTIETACGHTSVGMPVIYRKDGTTIQATGSDDAGTCAEGSLALASGLSITLLLCIVNEGGSIPLAYKWIEI